MNCVSEWRPSLFSYLALLNSRKSSVCESSVYLLVLAWNTDTDDFLMIHITEHALDGTNTTPATKLMRRRGLCAIGLLCAPNDPRHACSDALAMRHNPPHRPPCQGGGSLEAERMFMLVF